ncbi:MAG: TonB-dependent receptor [Zoogloeaceae bacterium]|nr:TonB-dependent receptor [Zoogloeaceae bacterium]
MPLRPALLLPALLACLPARADEAVRLPEVIVTGAPAEQDSFDSPLAIDRIPVQSTLRSRPGIDPSELLSGVAGLTVANRHNHAQDLQLSVRGFGARSAFGVRGVRLVADGIPAGTPDGQGQLATFDLDSAERIEVLRGPFATLYGNHSGGVVQLFSAPGESPPALSGGFMTGRWGTTRARVGAEGSSDDFAWRTNASRLESDGYRDHSVVRRNQSFARLDFTGTPGRRITLLASHLHQPSTRDPQGLSWERLRSDPRAVEAPARDFRTRKSVDHAQASLRLEQDFGADRLSLQGWAGRRSVVQFLSIPVAAQADQRSAGGVVDFARDFHGLGVRWSRVAALAGGTLTVSAGLDFERSTDDRRGYENFAGGTLGVRGALRRDERNLVTSTAPHAQAVWERGDWQWSAGLRHSTVRFRVEDDYVVGANGDDSGSVTYRRATPAVAVLWKAHPALNLYASASTGFETPTLGELSYSGAGDGFNFDLQPALSRQFEAGAKALLGTATRLNAALFAVRTRNEVVVAQSSGGRTSYTNAARTRRHGVELALESELTRILSLRGALTWMEAEYAASFASGSTDVPAGNRLPGVPRLNTSVELAWQAARGVTLSAEALHRSDMTVDDRGTGRKAPAHTLVNLALAAEQRQGPWTFGQMLRLDNVFDREYVSSVIVGQAQGRYYEPGPTRSWYAGMSLRYGF